MRSAELDAFTAECRAVEGTLAGIPADAWGLRALGEWTLHELVAHLVGGAARLAEYARAPEEADTPPAHDRVSYWQFDLDAEAPAVAGRARERAAQLAPEDMPEAFSTAWRSTVGAVQRLGPGGVIPTLRGPMRTGEYLATRVLEVCVHHIDVRAALDLPPTATPEAAKISMEICEALLGSPRPRNLGRTRFLLTATGRTPSNDARFPVIR